MGGRWSLVQIQSPRPFSRTARAGAGVRAPRTHVGTPRTPEPCPVVPTVPLPIPRAMMSYLSYRVADALVGALPDRTAELAARAVARVAHTLRVPARSRLERNLERLGGPGLAHARSREAFEHFAMTLTDFLRLGHVSRPELNTRVRIDGEEHLDTARRSGRGVIVVSAHVGSWELGAAWLAAHGIRL